MTRRTARSAAKSAAPQAFIAPPTDPQYALIVRGNCMANVLREGTTIAVDRDARPQAGDYVVLWFRPEHVPPGRCSALVKRLTHNVPFFVKAFPYTLPTGSEVSPAIMCEQFSPHASYVIEATRLLALHKVIGTFPKTKAIGGTQRLADMQPLAPSIPAS